MGMHKSTHLIFGIKFTRKDITNWGFEDWYDERLLPYIEGRPGTDIDILTGESDDVFAGRILAHSEYDMDDTCAMIPLDFAPVEISNKLNLIGIHSTPEKVHLYFVDMWN